ncbi:low temperature requirement protein A [Flavobacterium degerlachei]|jgi:low temperature requirement protein LtrA|uniref:Low temperature requirement protein LtrA n=1 Tax=Flavobacterium degerlachei TaxID=229203 RepID=A0A1H3EVL1_9FLAO|nr:low temperature requirement protein A [Flavobacterium degerlachei]SDX82665.1 Low temperature requirement protein LtrA [Flavobacterium degerlachei]
MNNRHATWLELFFDLIFVVALGKVTHVLAYTHNNQLDKGTFLKFTVLFLPFWWIWVLHTAFSNRYDTDNRFHRAFTLLLMFMLIILSITLDGDVEKNHMPFLLVYGVAKIIIAGLYAKDVLKINNRPINKSVMWAMGLGTLLATIGTLFNYKIAAVLLTSSIFFEIIVIEIALNHKNSTKAADKEHLVERIGLFAIILLGESIISIVSGLTKVDWTGLTIITGAVGFAIIAIIWWIYFDSLNFLIESKKDKNGTGVMYSQLLVFMSFAILANTIRHAILQDLNDLEFKIMAISGMLLLYIGKQTAYAINIPEHGKYRVINTIIALSIASISLLLPKQEYILIGVALSFMVYIIVNYKSQMKLYGKVNF